MKKIRSIFLVLGVLMFAGAGWFLWSAWQFSQTAQQAEGVVTDLEIHRDDGKRTYFPVITFTADNGKEIEFTSSSGGASWRNSLGESVSVLYQADNPRNATINSTFAQYGASIVLGGMGLVFFLIGAIPALISRIRGGCGQRLLREGRPIQAKIIDVERNEGVSMNGRSPWRIVCQWKNERGDVVLFHSQNLWYDPSEWLTEETIRVFLDKANEKKYYVDISALPKVA